MFFLIKEIVVNFFKIEEKINKRKKKLIFKIFLVFKDFKKLEIRVVIFSLFFVCIYIFVLILIDVYIVCIWDKCCVVYRFFCFVKCID